MTKNSKKPWLVSPALRGDVAASFDTLTTSRRGQEQHANMPSFRKVDTVTILHQEGQATVRAFIQARQERQLHLEAWTSPSSDKEWRKGGQETRCKDQERNQDLGKTRQNDVM